MRYFPLLVLLLCAPPAFAAPLLVVDAVPDADAPWLADAPARYQAWLDAHFVGTFLQQVAPIFAADLQPTRPLRVHLVAANDQTQLRAQTLGDDLAVQIRQNEPPERRADVIVHEAVHALQQRAKRTPHAPLLLDAQANGLLEEALATAIGQGLWRWLDHAIGENSGEIAWRRGRDRFAEDMARPWYVAGQKGAIIDTWARKLALFVAQAIAYGTPIDDATGVLQHTWRAALAQTEVGGQ